MHRPTVCRAHLARSDLPQRCGSYTRTFLKLHRAAKTSHKSIPDPLCRIVWILSAIGMDNVLDVRLDGPPRRDLRRVIELKDCFVIPHNGRRIPIRCGGVGLIFAYATAKLSTSSGLPLIGPFKAAPPST